MKKALSGILFLAMLLSLVTIPAMAEEDRPTLTVFVEAVATIEDFETNATTLWIEDQIGANLDFIVAPAGSAVEKMNILLNSKNYPDIFYLNVPDEDLYGVETGILMDLTPLIPEMEYFNYTLNNWPIIGQSMWAADGKLYAFPTYNDETAHGNFPVKYLYNSANFEELGMEVPTNLDELYDVLKAWKELDPENHLPLVGNTDNPPSDPLYFITNAFTYQPGNNWGYKLGLRLNGNTVETMYDDEEYREALSYMHTLYEEGLLYEASYTQNREQATALLASEGYPVLIWATTHNVRIVNASNTPDLYAATEFLAPLEGYNGEKYSTYIPQSVGAFMSISSTCEYPE
ncbi:MAG: extracellular solute-binding protein, partial [Oscillospiraceae bacterium]|nr:extracellular solute-binding protein [Oscillospiraceae bacterium]